MEDGLRPVLALQLGDLDAQTPEQHPEKAGVGQARHVGQPQGLVGEQAGGHQLDGRVLGAADGDLAVQPRAAGDDNTVH